MHRISLSSVVGLFLAAGHAYGGAGAPASLVTLTQNADLIVVGSASAGVQSTNTVSFALKVQRVVKGSPALAGSTIQVDWLTVSAAGAAPGLTGNGVWFLQ